MRLTQYIKKFLKKLLPSTEQDVQKQLVAEVEHLKEIHQQLISEITNLKEVQRQASNEIAWLKESYHPKKDKYEKLLDSLLRNYGQNPWYIREKTLALPQGEERAVYEKAYYLALRNTASWVGLLADIGPYAMFPHGLHGIFISNGAKIGKNAVIFQHVTIGSNSIEDSKKKGSPQIGENVYIGAGAKIIGGIKIGNNCRIGANAVVVEDVPDNSVVVLNKPRIIQKENMDNKFYQIRNGQKGYWLDGEFHVL